MIQALWESLTFHTRIYFPSFEAVASNIAFGTTSSLSLCGSCSSFTCLVAAFARSVLPLSSDGDGDSALAWDGGGAEEEAGFDDVDFVGGAVGVCPAPDSGAGGGEGCVGCEASEGASDGVAASSSWMSWSSSSSSAP